MKPALIDFISALDSSPNFPAAWAATLKFFEAQGHPWICYGYFKPLRSADSVAPEVNSNIPASYLDGWASADIYACDPLIQHVKASVLPGQFGPDYIDRTRDGEAVFRYYEELRKLGARTSLAVPLKGPKREMGFLEFGGALRRQEFERFLANDGGTLLAAVHYADARMLELLGTEGLREVHLTRREIECLEWLSAGLMNDRIAERMRISEPTVRMHLANARRKLKALTREQALVKALKLGLLAV